MTKIETDRAKHENCSTRPTARKSRSTHRSVLVSVRAKPITDAMGYWVFQHQNKREKYAPRNVRPKARDGNLSRMIWACFVGDKLGPIAFISGSVTQDAYISLLQQYLDPFVEALGADGETNVEFQQDNARPHTAQKTRGFLEALARKHVLTLMDWLANSPNLSPIENLWVHLKHKLHERYPDTTTLKGSPETI